ncbi:MAG: RNA polymerase sigma factor [Oscillospiraceae bacterium]|nr:RNA polymerase sigma factor [Oscillospiraceae bacterium]MDD6147176.1 RNA polymerase sigma factor [Oscillospiraceae bacterium]
MKDSFERLVETYADTVTRICYVNLESRADAEDAWQNVFIKLFKSKKLWDKPDEELRKWLVTVTLNECRDMKRKLFHRNHSDIDEMDVSYAPDFDRDLVRAVRNLPTKYRQVIELYYFEGYSISEISGILSEKENTIKSRMKRGKELLKGDLTNES